MTDMHIRPLSTAKKSTNQSNILKHQLKTPRNAFLYFRKSRNTSCLSHKILHNDCIRFLLGHEDDPREIENNGYANFWGGKRGVLRDLRTVENSKSNSEILWVMFAEPMHRISLLWK